MTDDARTCWHGFFASFGEGATTYNLEFGEYCVLDKETKVKFGIVIHYTRGLLYCVHIDIWGPAKTASLGGY